MKREEKNALSRRRILDAAMEDFSQKGYEGASLSTVFAERGISKGVVYHHFKDKDTLYLLCVERCFSSLTEALSRTAETLCGTPEEMLQIYFDQRLRFFADHPQYYGIFADAVFHTPAALADEIASRRVAFDALNLSVLTSILRAQPLRAGLDVESIVEDFHLYMDFFNLRFGSDFLSTDRPAEELLQKHEERCHRQLSILLHGVLGENSEKE
ncbi:MAG: TetR/AcrR family transcriptional regulator [Anaerovoracaceae bacterium]